MTQHAKCNNCDKDIMWDPADREWFHLADFSVWCTAHSPISVRAWGPAEKKDED